MSWQKVLLSGSNIHVNQITASLGNANQNDTLVFYGDENNDLRHLSSIYLSSSTHLVFQDGIYSGSFVGDGSGIVGVSASFPSVEKPNIVTADRFYIEDQSGGPASKYITYGNLLTDLAGTGINVEGSDSLNIDSASLAGSGLVAQGNALVLDSASLNHDDLLGFVADEHIGHSTVTLTAGAGLTGGGDITTSRTFNVGAGNGITVAADTVIFDSESIAGNGLIATGNELRVLAADTTISVGAGGIQVVEANLSGIPNSALTNSSIGISAGTNGTGSSDGWSLGESITINGTADEVNVTVSNNSLTIGLPNDVIIGNDLTVTGDLVVNGSTTSINTTNLDVEDRFVLLNSGSSTGDGGIIVQTESTTSGAAFGWDDSATRWSVQNNTKLSSTATTISPDAYVATVIDVDGGQSDIAAHQQNGNFKVEGSELFVWVA